MAEPQQPLKTTGMALHGQHFMIDDIKPQPQFPQVNKVTIVSKWSDYEPATDIDYSDLSKVNHELIELRIRLHQVRKELRDAERAMTKTKWVYEGKKKRFLIGLSGGSEKAREAAAELMCEEEYSAYLVALNILKEIQQHSRDMRSDLDLLKEISNNLRRQIDLT